MTIFYYIYAFLFSSSVTFILVASIIESNLSEEHPVMIWWRRHVIGIYVPDNE